MQEGLEVSAFSLGNPFWITWLGDGGIQAGEREGLQRDLNLASYAPSDRSWPMNQRHLAGISGL